MLGVSALFSTVLVAVAVCQVTGRPDPPHDGPFALFGSFEAMKDQIDKCGTEAGITKQEFLEGRLKGNEPSKAEMCFTKCLGTAAGAIKANGELDVNFIKEKIPQKLKEETSTITACLEKVGPISECEDVAKILKCFPKPPKMA